MGLTLNFTKCEVIQSHEVDLPASLDSFATTPPDDACLLGTPLSAGNALEVALEKRCSELSLGLSRLLDTMPSFSSEVPLAHPNSFILSAVSRAWVTHFLTGLTR